MLKKSFLNNIVFNNQLWVSVVVFFKFYDIYNIV